MMHLFRRAGHWTKAAALAGVAAAGLAALPSAAHAADGDTTVDLNTVPANDAAQRLRLQVTIAREKQDPIFLESPGPLNHLRLKLTYKNLSDPLSTTAGPTTADTDFGTPMVLKLKPGRSLKELAQEGVNPEDVLEIRPGVTIQVDEKPVLDIEFTGNADAVAQYTNADGSKEIPKYKSYDTLTKSIAAANDDNSLRAALQQFAQDAGLEFEPMGAHMAEKPNLITTLPTPDLGSGAQVEIYVFRKLSADEQAAWKEQHPGGTPPAMLSVPRATRNLFAASQSSGAQEVLDSGKERDTSIETNDPYIVDLGHNFKFTREGQYVAVASVLGRRANISNKLEFEILPYWRTGKTLTQLDQWINHNRSLGPFEYTRMVYLVHGENGGLSELVYSKRFANGKIVHHEFYRLGKVHPEHENDIEVTVVDANVLKVKFIEGKGKQCIARIDFSYSSPNTSLNLAQ